MTPTQHDMLDSMLELSQSLRSWDGSMDKRAADELTRRGYTPSTFHNITVGELREVVAVAKGEGK